MLVGKDTFHPDWIIKAIVNGIECSTMSPRERVTHVSQWSTLYLKCDSLIVLLTVEETEKAGCITSSFTIRSERVKGRRASL